MQIESPLVRYLCFASDETFPVYGCSMGHCLYSFLPSRGPLSPSFSGNPSSLDNTPSAFAECHDSTQQPANSRSVSPTRGGGPPANTAPNPDVVTCQWEDCSATFNNLSTFIGVHHFPLLGCLTLAKSPDIPVFRRSHWRGREQIQPHLLWPPSDFSLRVYLSPPITHR